MATDEELVEEILAGSQAAMEVLVKRHYKTVFAYVYRKLGDYHKAYDLTQEIFIKMMKHIDSYSEKGKFKNWLLTIAVNSCRDYYRSKSFREAKSEVELKTNLLDDKNNVADFFDKKVQREEIRVAIEGLPEYQKEVVLLRFYHDLKIKEIAKATDSKEATVKSRLRQGLTKLGSILKRGEDHVQAKNRG